MRNIIYILTCLTIMSCSSLDKITRRNKPEVELPKIAFVGVKIIPMTKLVTRRSSLITLHYPEIKGTVSDRLHNSQP